MEPLLDKISRLKKERPRILLLTGVCMFFLPTLLFVIGAIFGYNAVEPDPAFPIAFVLSIGIAFFSPFVMFSNAKWTTLALTIVFWAILFVQYFILSLIGDLMLNHWRLMRC
jgi:hypothetical protein